MNRAVFKTYDIRGKADVDFDNASVLKLGRALGTYFQRRGSSQVVVGRDIRRHSLRIENSLTAGLLASGCSVVPIGETITPCFYFAHHHLGIDSGVMVTASHNPPEDNGFKIFHHPGTIFGEEIQEVRRIVEEQTDVDSVQCGSNGVLRAARVEDYYVGEICRRIKLGTRKPIVVLDAGNGTAGSLGVRVLSNLGCQVIPLYCESNPDFPHHHPDPTQTTNLIDLRQTVLEEGADLGVALDGDGDRLGVIDDKGNIVWGDILQVLFWRELLPKYPGAHVIVEVKCSQALVDEVQRLGGKPFYYKTGHSLIKAKMREIGAIFTAEMSGHFFFADEYHGYDDAIYAAARLLRTLSESGTQLSALLASVPKYFTTQETRISCIEAAKEKVVAELKRRFLESGREVIDVDGVRVQFDGGWCLVRASNTQSVLVARCEASSMDRLLEITALLQGELRRFPEVEDFEWQMP